MTLANVGVIIKILETAKVPTVMISDMFTKIPIGLLPYAFFIPEGGNYHTSLFHSSEISAVCPSCSNLGLKTIRTPVCG